MVSVAWQETRDQAIARLAQRARESGVAIRRDRTGRYFVSSASQRGSWHYCTAVSCDCRGFASHGRCMHHSLLLTHLGWVDDGGPTPEPVVCAACNGQGSTPATEIYMGRRVEIAVPCWHCRQTGRVAA